MTPTKPDPARVEALKASYRECEGFRGGVSADTFALTWIGDRDPAIADLECLTKLLDECRTEAARIADDYHPDMACESDLALQEMREAVTALVARIDAAVKP